MHNNTFDVVMLLVFGVAGHLLKKCNYPLAPLVLAIVLGDRAEEAFRQSLLISQGSLGVFWSNGLVSTIMILGLIALFWPLLSNLYGRLLTPRCTSESASAVALAPQCNSLDQKIIEAPLPPGASDFSVRALDATTARETLMTTIMSNAVAPIGCVSNLERFEH